MRLPFLRPKDPAAPRPRPAAAPTGEDAAVQAARTRARQRLVGALVLLALGVIGFPVIFDTQPRPMSPDLPIEVMRPDGMTAARPVPAPPAKVLPLNLPPADAGLEVAAETAASAAAMPPVPLAQSAVAPVVVATPPAARASAPMPKPAASAAAPAPVRVASAAAARVAAAALPVASTATAAKAPAARPTPAAEGAGTRATQAAVAAAPASAAAAGRFVVQAGAYIDASKLRDARQKVERLGLKTYTQVIDTEGGQRTRVRVGPFSTRQEAEAVAAKVKAAGLQANVLTL